MLSGHDVNVLDGQLHDLQALIRTKTPFGALAARAEEILDRWTAPKPPEGTPVLVGSGPYLLSPDWRHSPYPSTAWIYIKPDDDEGKARCEVVAAMFDLIEEGVKSAHRKDRYAAMLSEALDDYLSLRGYDVSVAEGDNYDPIEDCLRGQKLKLYLFLRKTTRWTNYDTLAGQSDFWRKPDPNDGTIHKALKELQAGLTAIEDRRIVLVIEHESRRVRLEK